MVSRSSAEAEYRTVVQGMCKHFRMKLLVELKIEVEGPMKLHSDSKAAINIAHNPIQHDRAKHVEIDRHFIKEKLESEAICMPRKTSRCFY